MTAPAGTHIRISVEFVPDGDLMKKRDLGRAYLTNVGGGDYIGDYELTIMRGAVYGRGARVWKSGRIFDVPRSKLGPWDVLFRLLHAIVGVRNTGACNDAGARKSARHNAKRRAKKNVNCQQTESV